MLGDNDMSDRLPLMEGSAPEVFRLQRNVETIADLNAFRALRREWDELVARAHDYSFCLTYSYCEIAASVLFTAGGVVEVIRLYDERGLCALWPVAIHRKGLLRVAKALSCGADEEYGGPLVRDESGADVFSQLVQATAKLHADVLQVRFVTKGGVLHQALETRPQSWFLPFVPNGLRDDVPGFTIGLREYPRWEDFAATRSTSALAELRRHSKRLSAKGRMELGWCKTVEDADTVITWLFANKRRWAMARQLHTKYLMSDQVRDFFTQLARQIDLSTIPLVTFLKVDGEPVAASLNLVGSRWFEGFITTYDESFGACSPGSVMHEFCMKWAHANGRDFDLRPVYSGYKVRWADCQTIRSTPTIFLSVRGRIAEFSLLTGYWLRVKGRLRETMAGVRIHDIASRFGPGRSTRKPPPD